MRRNEAGAFHEFFSRFAPLVTALARARRMPSAGLTERVNEFLDDAALRLARIASAPPHSLAAYLAAAFRRRDHNRVRDLRCREELRDAYSVDAGGGSERTILSATSEDAVRISHGPGWERATLSPAIERLALALEEGLSNDERQLLAWLGARVPQREIALWLGVTHGAMRVRITRLRARLRDAALRHAFRLEGPERAEIARFFRRVDIEIPVGAVDLVQRGGFGNDGSQGAEDQDR
jgi:RNA polymerase sigma factor (sigma-70 family)